MSKISKNVKIIIFIIVKIVVIISLLFYFNRNKDEQILNDEYNKIKPDKNSEMTEKINKIIEDEDFIAYLDALIINDLVDYSNKYTEELIRLFDPSLLELPPKYIQKLIKVVNSKIHEIRDKKNELINKKRFSL